MDLIIMEDHSKRVDIETFCDSEDEFKTAEAQLCTYRIQQNLSLQTFMFCTLMMLILRFMKHETTDRREAQKEELENSKKIF